MVTTNQADLNQEIELKLQLLNGATGESLWMLPFVKKGLKEPPEEKDLHSTYYDTSDHKLLKQGFTLRVRKNKDDFTITVKKIGNVTGGLHQRAEWNYPSSDEKPTLRGIEDLELQQNMENIVGDRELRVLMTTAFKRNQADWEDENGDLLEIAIDEGWIKTPKGEEVISEVELELKKGSAKTLIMLGQQLSGFLPMNLNNESKFYRGIKMMGLGQESVPTQEKENGKSALLTEDSSLGSVIPRLLEELFHSMMEPYQRLYQQQTVGEEVHQVRVKSRQARSLLKFFRPALSRESCKLMEEEFRSVAKWFSRLRETQVMKYHIQQALCITACKQLEEIINLELMKELESFEKELQSGYMTPHILRLWAMITSIQVNEPYVEESISRFARKKMKTWLKKYKKSQRSLIRKDFDKLHQLRIRVKRVRYVAEYLRPVLPRNMAKPIKSLKQEQELYGELHDIHCERIKLRDWIGERENTLETMYQLGLYEGCQYRREQQLWEGILK